MNARLLDLGSLGAVRAHGVGHAITASMRPDHDPVVLLFHPNRASVSIGSAQDAARELDLEQCRARDLPVMQRLAEGDTWLHDSNQLTVQLVLPTARGVELGLLADDHDRASAVRDTAFRDSPIAACRTLGLEAEVATAGRIEVAGRALGFAELGSIDEAICFSTTVWFDYDRPLMAQISADGGGADGGGADRGGADSVNGITTLWEELTPTLGLAAVAEALIGELESRYGFELVPSMPTLHELDAILDWDERTRGRSHDICARDVSLPLTA